jgi:biopolymer transport protein ExbB
MKSRTSVSRLRIFFWLIAAGVILWGCGNGWADSGSSAATPVQPREGVLDLIGQNIDFVFVTLCLLSIIGVTLIIQGFIKCRRDVFMPPESINAMKEMIANKQFKELMEFTEADPSFVSRSLNPALKRAPNFNNMKEAMETAVGEQTAEQFRRIEYLNIIGNLGPLLGLLGTVLGMIDAFQALHAAQGQANPADLAYGISKALCHTMLGLMLAVPCLAAFGVLRTMVDRLTVQGAMEAEELLLMIKPGDGKGGPVVARAGAIPQPGAMLETVRTPPAPTPLVTREG